MVVLKPNHGPGPWGGVFPDGQLLSETACIFRGHVVEARALSLVRR